MYESITYSELKKLPKDQKSNAWKELSTICSTKKELAQKLGVSPAIVYNMISKYVEGKPIGKRKSEKKQLAEQPKKLRGRAGRHKKEKIPELKAAGLNEAGEIKLVSTAADILNEKKADDSFSIAIKKTVNGEDAQFFLNGIGSTLLKNQEYVIEVRITEK